MIFAIVIHTYMILLFLLYVAYCRGMWAATVSTEMCLSINGIKCVGEYKIAQNINTVVTSMFHIHALKENLNLYNKN